MNELHSVSAMRPARKHRLRDGTMRFGVFWPYSRTLIPSATIAERNPDVLDVHNHVRLAQAIEAVGIDFTLIADGYAPASAENSRIGFQDPLSLRAKQSRGYGKWVWIASSLRSSQ
ncbi:MAG: hypothetical protein JO230_00650 [Xanthobacteraceae bacterium]|nr:hypothetical protein [Xanthobacteraceae bacterium]